MYDHLTQDEEHLKLLSIFHYVLGGVNALFACIPIIHVVIGAVIMFGGMQSKSGGPPAAFGAFFFFIGLAMVILGWTIAACLLIAGGKLRRHESYTFCFIVACVSCILMPFGTILGVFTLIILSRPSVKELFEQNWS